MTDPGNMLEHRRRRMPIGKMDMDLSHIADMRDNRQPMGVHCMCDLDEFGDAPHSCHVRLHDMDCSGLEKVVECLRRIQLLTQRDGDRG